MTSKTLAASLLLSLISSSSLALETSKSIHSQIDQKSSAIEAKVIEWRRDFHQHPELSDQEVRTADIVAKHLRKLGLEVKTGVARTGVVGLLKGGRPGPVVALRADMDALPITERAKVPFASKVQAEYKGEKVGVMHACGHDAHVAILMGVAEILSSMKDQLKGSVKFIFQPAEEGSLPGMIGGAPLMIKEGVLQNPKVDAIFGLHIRAPLETGKIAYRSGGMMASADEFSIKVKGKGSHGGYPWEGIDPVVTASQIVLGLQTIVSRNVDLTENAAVVSVGTLRAGTRNNIIPEEVTMTGTIRSLNPVARKLMHERVTQVAQSIAQSAGATAEVAIQKNTAITNNDAALVEKMLPTLQRVGGKSKVAEYHPVMGAEDFSFYQEKVPGFFFFVGAGAKGKPDHENPSHHTPDFFIEESSFVIGVRALSQMAVDYLGAVGK